MEMCPRERSAGWIIAKWLFMLPLLAHRRAALSARQYLGALAATCLTVKTSTRAQADPERGRLLSGRQIHRLSDAAFQSVDRAHRVSLNLLSEALVAKAGSGSTPAHEFRIEARMYRELLRQTMLSDRERPVNAQMPQPLLLDMVRMSALLHSAADCKTGFVITCPADLMLQLKSQQAKVTQGLNMTKMMYE